MCTSVQTYQIVYIKYLQLYVNHTSIKLFYVVSQGLKGLSKFLSLIKMAICSIEKEGREVDSVTEMSPFQSQHCQFSVFSAWPPETHFSVSLTFGRLINCKKIFFEVNMSFKNCLATYVIMSNVFSLWSQETFLKHFI